MNKKLKEHLLVSKARSLNGAKIGGKVCEQIHLETN